MLIDKLFFRYFLLKMYLKYLFHIVKTETMLNFKYNISFHFGNRIRVLNLGKSLLHLSSLTQYFFEVAKIINI